MKRGVDVVASAVALVLLSPLLAAVALVVRAKLGSPVLFVQERPGRGGRIFRIYKFRTMRAGAAAPDAVSAVATDAVRLTPFGARLRAWSLDEIPELVNVLKGDMSIVGPRPLLPEYLGRYTEQQARRHEVRPGITGWAQVNGRNELPWEERLAMDVWYVDNRSAALDARILLRTIGSVLKRQGVSGEGVATMEPFDPGVPATVAPRDGAGEEAS
ncbi:MAG: sugar transferase [Coriobacteriia bacterium]|nr:sugar transferase [Coriobacteriia bacterium]